MLEIDCIVNGFDRSIEIGTTEDEMVIFCKAKKPISEIIDSIRVDLSRWSMDVNVLKTKEDVNGNVVLLKMFFI